MKIESLCSRSQLRFLPAARPERLRLMPLITVLSAVDISPLTGAAICSNQLDIDPAAPSQSLLAVGIEAQRPAAWGRLTMEANSAITLQPELFTTSERKSTQSFKIKVIMGGIEVDVGFIRL